MAPIGLKHWMLHNGQLAKEYDETLKLSPGFDPVREVDPALTFHAPLLTAPDSIPGAIRAIFERNSHASYLAPRGAFLLNAEDDESRHEYTPDDEPLGVLMEPASTNKCINYNADAQAENMFLGGDPSATLTYVNDAEELNRAGLDRVAGKVYRLNNSAGTEFARANPLGECGNTNPHIVQAYWRGTGQGEIRLSGSGAGPESVPAHYELEANFLTPTSPTNGLEVRAQPGADIYFILNQLEEPPVPTSVIVTEGAAYSRAVDQLSWPLAGEPYGAQKKLDDSEQQGIITNATSPWVSVENLGFYSISDSLITRAATGSWEAIRQNAPLEVGAWYRLVIQVFDDTNDGELILYIGNEDLAINATAGMHDFVAMADISRIQIGSAFWSGTLRVSYVKQASPILNQAEGMAALLWRPGYDEGVLPPATQRALVTFYAGNISLMWLNTTGSPYSVGVGDGTTTIEVAFAEPIEAGKEYLILVTWGDGGNKRIGIKADGVTRWSSPSAYDGAFVEEGFMRIYNQPYAPEHYKHLYLWSVDRGIDWLESFFEGVAN